MKILLLVILFYLVSCSTSNEKKLSIEEKGKELVMAHLKLYFYDPNSYEPIEFGPIQKKHEEFVDSKMQIRFKSDSINLWLAITNNKISQLKYDFSMNLLKEKHRIDSLYWSNHIPWFYTISHSFRAKNNIGVLEKFNKTFVIDSSITQVLDSTLASTSCYILNIFSGLNIPNDFVDQFSQSVFR